jgi:hypothetical protein
MAAGEDQLEPLIAEGQLLHLVSPRRRLEQLGLEQLGLRCERALATQAVDRAVARGGDEPGGRVGRCPLTRPALRRDGERILDGLLGEVEIAEEAD